MNKAKTKAKPLLSGNVKKNFLLYNKYGETRIYLILSFLLPFIIMWYFFMKNEVHPFGDKQILVTDLWHQYYPFFRIEHEKLQNLSSFLYSWDTGLGTNFISLMSYYAGSPLNLLSVFFPIEYSRDALTLFLTIKIGCAGLFFAIFLKHTFKKNDISITAFALCFALCNYIMGYYWNIIWMDTVALLPLVVLGTVKLFREGKFKLYVISLALSLITSFYIGLFTCIFTVLVFGALLITEWKGFKYSFKRLGQIAGFSLIGIGIGAIILLPAYLGLMLTNSAENEFPKDITFYESWSSMISSVVGFQKPTAKEGMPNFYCGMFAVILLGVFIRSRKVKIREKIVTVIYLAFIIVSCNMNVLNYMWHGFHFTNMLPYRFSFLLSFILLAAGYRAFIVLKEERNPFDVIALSVMAFIIMLISYTSQTEKTMISNVIVCAVFVVIMVLHQIKLINAKILNFAVFGVCFFEMSMNAALGVKTVSVTGYSIYPRKNAEITSLIDSVESKDDGFYRIETTTNYTINDPALYGYRGVSQFSSTANVNITNLMNELGIQASDAGNRYYYNQTTAVMNMFLNLKYIIAADGYSGDLTYLAPLAKKDGVSIYENNHYLPIGFAANNDVTEYEGESFIQAENVNELFSRATGIEEDVIVNLEIENVGHKGLNVIKAGHGNYNFQHNPSTDGSSDCYLKYNYKVSNDGPVYVSFDFNDVNTLKIKSGNSVLRSHNNGKYMNIFAAGDFEAGDIVTLQANVEKEKSGNGTIYVYQINQEVFEEGYKKLAAGGLDVTEYSDTKIKGNINVSEDCVMYTSIPHDGGWKAYVDGKETEVKTVKNAFLCVPLTKGEHTVELKYCPPGFIVGVMISIASLALFILCWIVLPKYAKNNTVLETISESKESEKTDEEQAENVEDVTTETAEDMVTESEVQKPEETVDEE